MYKKKVDTIGTPLAIFKLLSASNAIVLIEYLSYSKANSSCPILGISGCISKTDESDATLSHDSARRIAGGISASEAKNRTNLKFV